MKLAPLLSLLLAIAGVLLVAESCQRGAPDREAPAQAPQRPLTPSNRPIPQEIDTFRTALDFIIGKPGGTVTRRDFFTFQREWNEMNQRLEFHMSGMLWLIDEDSQSVEGGPSEHSRDGRVVAGESIGRPGRARVAT